MIKGEKNNIDLSFEDMQFLLALYETQSLTQTAGDMRLSMGAASRRLSHVREVFGDELFVRSGCRCCRRAACASSGPPCRARGPDASTSQSRAA